MSLNNNKLMYLSNTSDHFGTSNVVYILLNPIKSQIFNFNKVLNDLDVECFLLELWIKTSQSHYER